MLESFKEKSKPNLGFFKERKNLFLGLFLILIASLPFFLFAVLNKTYFSPKATSLSVNFGKALKFDSGSQPSCVFVSSSSATLMEPVFTLEAWIKPYYKTINGANYQNPHTIIAKEFPDGRAPGYSLSITNRKFEFGIDLAQGENFYRGIITGKTTLKVNQWYHVALIRLFNTFYLIVDGYLDQNPLVVPGDLLVDSQKALTIGCAHQEGGPLSFLPSVFYGEIDEVRISHIPRIAYPLQKPTMPFIVDNYTMGLWHFDNDVNDSSNNKINSQILGPLEFVNSNISIPTLTPTPTINPNIFPLNIPVLVLKYFPIIGDPQTATSSTLINREITGGDLSPGTTLGQVREITERINNQLIEALENGSRYHGYKDSNALSRLNYSIVETKEFLRPILRTDNENWDFVPDHLNELRNLNICDYVENRGIKEVWIWMYHYTPDLNGDGQPDKDPNRYYVAPVESNMAGPYGDISNSGHFPDLPVCRKTYTVYEYNYGRGIGEALEDHTHQIEAIFGHIDSNVWNKFVGSTAEPFACGWTHCPPNVMFDCANHQYDWSNERTVLSDCEDWRIDRIGQVKPVNCHTWAGEDC